MSVNFKPFNLVCLLIFVFQGGYRRTYFLFKMKMFYSSFLVKPNFWNHRSVNSKLKIALRKLISLKKWKCTKFQPFYSPFARFNQLQIHQSEERVSEELSHLQRLLRWQFHGTPLRPDLRETGRSNHAKLQRTHLHRSISQTIVPALKQCLNNPAYWWGCG